MPVREMWGRLFLLRIRLNRYVGTWAIPDVFVVCTTKPLGRGMEKSGSAAERLC